MTSLSRFSRLKLSSSSSLTLALFLASSPLNTSISVMIEMAPTSCFLSRSISMIMSVSSKFI